MSISYRKLVKEGNWNGMDSYLELKIVIDRRRFTTEHCTVEGETKTETIVVEPSDRLHEKQKHERRYGRW